MLKKNKLLSYFAYALGEILLIVVGIMLALYLQNRNEMQKTQEAVATTLSFIEAEISSNKNRIKNVQEYHDMIKDTLGGMDRKDLPQTEEEADGMFGFWRGMQIPRLQNSAFQTGIQTGISKELDPELLQKLNDLYTLQDSHNDFNTSSSQIFFNNDFSDINSLSKILASVQMVMNDLYYYENGLMKLFDQNLQKIDSLQTNY